MAAEADAALAELLKRYDDGKLAALVQSGGYEAHED
jgi:hypothetical protein